MSQAQARELNERTRRAIAELKQTISERYPSATFEIAPAADDPSIIHLITAVDLDDPDEVGDLVIDRVAELVAEEHLPIHVVPIRTPERIKASPEQTRARQRPIPSLGLIKDRPVERNDSGVLRESSPTARPRVPCRRRPGRRP